MMNFENQTTESKRKKQIYTASPVVKHYWHVEKNGAKKPEHYMPKSKSTAWFICEKKHEWCGAIATTANNGCPHCESSISVQNSLQAKHPKIAQEWDGFKNNHKTPDLFLPESYQVMWWKCGSCESLWRESIASRVLSGLKYCKSCRTSDIPTGTKEKTVENKELKKPIPKKSGVFNTYQQVVMLAQSKAWGNA